MSSEELLRVGSILIAFGPAVGLLVSVVWSRAHLVVLQFIGGVFWLFSLLMIAILWTAIPPAKDAWAWVLIMGTLIQEGMRFLAVKGYMTVEKNVEKTLPHRQDYMPLNDFVAALSLGSGFGAMHALMQFGTVAAAVGTSSTLFLDSCESTPAILLLALTALLFWILDVVLMFAAFSAMRRPAAESLPQAATIVLLHLGASLATLGNLRDDGCQVTMPVLTAVVGVAVAWVWLRVRLFMPSAGNAESRRVEPASGVPMTGAAGEAE